VEGRQGFPEAVRCFSLNFCFMLNYHKLYLFIIFMKKIIKKGLLGMFRFYKFFYKMRNDKNIMLKH